MFLKLGMVSPWVQLIRMLHVIEGDGGGQQASCLVAKQAAGLPILTDYVSKAEQALLHGCVGGGGGATCLVAKQAVEFPQVT